MREIVNRQHGRRAISAVTLAELVLGAGKSQFPARNLDVGEDFCSRLTILPYTPEVAYHYASISAALERSG
ncbi:MAG: type II toxin-antitoxin system VapC family toxin [Candidatus Dechloromonas phosphoritropha]